MDERIGIRTARGPAQPVADQRNPIFFFGLLAIVDWRPACNGKLHHF